MSIRVGINGFGRIGRLVARSLANHPELTLVQINDPGGSSENQAHLLAYDSVHGHWDHPVDYDDHHLIIDGRPIPYTQGNSPANTPWQDNGVELLIECSGRFKTEASLLPYFEHDIQKVLVSAPCSDPILNIVYGVNHDQYQPDRDHIISAASCTTNCLAPVVKVLHETVGIQRGVMTTIHAVTNTQRILDNPHKDLRRARAYGPSIIPTTTGSAKAIGKIFPELESKINGMAVRVPVINASLTDFVFEAAQPTSIEAINQHLQHAAEGALQGILGFETRPFVSEDYKDDPRSSIVDAPSTMVVDNTQVKVLMWYDNEWGYTQRLLDMAKMMAATI